MICAVRGTPGTVWIPAFAGMTMMGEVTSYDHFPNPRLATRTPAGTSRPHPRGFAAVSGFSDNIYFIVIPAKAGTHAL